MKSLISIWLILLFTANHLAAQDFENSRSINASLDFLQIKESENYGLVYSGPQIRLSYRNSWEINMKDLVYEGSAGFAYLRSRGTSGLNIHVKVLDLHYNIYERERDVSFFAGPWIKMEYNYQLYPELQSGYSFHFTNYTFGFSVSSTWQTDDFHLTLRWKNSLAGLISRTETGRDPYFFDLSFGDYLRDQHKAFKGGSFNLYNNSMVELHYVDPQHPRIAYAYSFQYFVYSDFPELKSLSHGFTVYFYPRSLK
jgi:hypothetical protein